MEVDDNSKLSSIRQPFSSINILSLYNLLCHIFSHFDIEKSKVDICADYTKKHIQKCEHCIEILLVL